MSEKLDFKTTLVLGLALFAMFFGAGNLIFPPAVGLEGGTDWWIGYLTYFIADVGLALLSIFAMIKADGVLGRVTGPIGKVGSVILNTAIILCIGPMLALPRTAATSYEMGMTSVLGTSADNVAAQAIYSIVFFALAFLLAMRQNRVMGRIGKVLTPILVIVLAVLIIAGIVNPAAPAAAPTVANLVEEGVLNGYQTMDMLAGLIFAIVFVRTVKLYGQGDRDNERHIAFNASIIAGILLFAVYGGLSYLGATTGQLWSSQFADGTVNQAGLLANISNAVLGQAGAGFLAVIVVFACLTTAIALISSCSAYFETLFKGKVSYTVIAAIITIFSAFICNIGLSNIIAIAAPILSVVYPTALFLTVMSFFRTETNIHRVACVLGSIASLIVSLCGVLVDTLGVTALTAIHTLPLDSFGFGWLVPTIIAALIGLIFDRAHHAQGTNATQA